MLPAKRSVGDVLEWCPEAVLAWVQQHCPAIDCREDWQDLAYGCSSTATCNSGLSEDEVVAWATAAVLIYDRLGEICAKPSDRSYFAASAMSLRAFMINKFGPQSGHPVKDPKILEDWFFRRVDMPHAAAVLMSENSLNLSTPDFLRISSLKDRVRLMRSVQPQQGFARRDELNRWYELLDTPSE
jgi:hypothetical protein